MARRKQKEVLLRIPETVYRKMMEERALSGDGRSFELTLNRFLLKPSTFTATLLGSRDPEGE